jgi:hypothetical protein
MKLDHPVSILVIPDSGVAPFVAGGGENIAAARKLLANPSFLKEMAGLSDGAASAFFIQKSLGCRLLPVTLFQATPFPADENTVVATPAATPQTAPANPSSEAGTNPGGTAEEAKPEIQISPKKS